jgi:spoIIIJ-associated protein
MKKETKVLQRLTEELLSLMSTEASVEVSFDEKNNVFNVNIGAGDETGLLIGKKGETLTSIQTILGFLLKKETGEWGRVVVNVGDYRQKEEDYLKNLALTTAERVKETGEPQNLYNLKPWQRRVIHLTLSNDSGVTTESQGEGEERYLVIKPKK